MDLQIAKGEIWTKIIWGTTQALRPRRSLDSKVRHTARTSTLLGLISTTSYFPLIILERRVQEGLR
jgi:hypothetical protein